MQYPGSWEFRLYALGSPGVPVLFGMRVLEMLQVVSNMSTGKSIIAGQPVNLKKNSKGHLIIDLVQHMPHTQRDGPRAYSLCMDYDSVGTMSTRNSHYTDQAPDHHSDKTQRIYMDML